MNKIENIKEYVDFTFLKKDINSEEVIEKLAIALKNGYYGFCIYPEYLKSIKDYIIHYNSNIKLVTVIDFPNGVKKIEDKINEAHESILTGADELDIVMNYNSLKFNFNIVEDEIRKISAFQKDNNILVKLIIESEMLDFNILDKIIELVNQHPIAYIKTSTGKLKIGAEIDKVKYLKSKLNPNIKIKASGGIRDKETALKFIESGANRIGTSAEL